VASFSFIIVGEAGLEIFPVEYCRSLFDQDCLDCLRDPLLVRPQVFHGRNLGVRRRLQPVAARAVDGHGGKDDPEAARLLVGAARVLALAAVVVPALVKGLERGQRECQAPSAAFDFVEFAEYGVIHGLVLNP
jgi:hypothetical protein